MKEVNWVFLIDMNDDRGLIEDLEDWWLMTNDWRLMTDDGWLMTDDRLWMTYDWCVMTDGWWLMSDVDDNGKMMYYWW